MKTTDKEIKFICDLYDSLDDEGKKFIGEYVAARPANSARPVSLAKQAWLALKEEELDEFSTFTLEHMR